MADRKILVIGSVAAVVVLVAGGAIIAMQNRGDPFAECRASTVAGGMDSFGTDFTLTDQAGQSVTAAEVFDKPSLLYFGYTFCPDVCPLDMARNSEAALQLQEQGLDTQPVFITVDPRRDTTEVLAQYASFYDAEIKALTGTDEQIADVNKGWRNYYKAHDEEDDEFYLVDHMTNTYLVLPGNRTVEFFPRAMSPEDVASRSACYIRNSS